MMPKQLKAEMRRAKAAKVNDAVPAAGSGAVASASTSPDLKRRKLDAAETAQTLSRAAYDEDSSGKQAATVDRGSDDEAPAAFDGAHYGALGLNGRFEARAPAC